LKRDEGEKSQNSEYRSQEPEGRLGAPVHMCTSALNLLPLNDKR
jgi:hypothetical protein